MIRFSYTTISTIAEKLKNASLTTVITVVFVLGGALFSQSGGRVSAGAAAEIFGGPEEDSNFSGAQTNALLAAFPYSGGEAFSSTGAGSAGIPSAEEAMVISPATPLGGSVTERESVLIYKVEPGDTLTGVANRFGVTLNTILWANPNLRATALRIGQEIVVLPVSGILHTAEPGETLTILAGLYGVSREEILKANPKAAEALAPGEELIVPGERPRAKARPEERLPDLRGYFALPTSGWNWGRLHNYNAVDIANSCGTPVYAAAEGLVAEAGDPSGWNQGYGGFVEIEHPNGTLTRYAHTGKNLAAVGDYVKQGALIAEMGNTGNTHGPTGCHLHFEVKNAKNPLAK